MVPLETLDSYMVVCAFVGATYLLIMLGLLLHFLRKYHWGPMKAAAERQEMELGPVVAPYQYTVVTQSSDSVTHSCATRSNHSFSSKLSSHAYGNPAQPKKMPCVRIRPDLTQMEMLATL